MNGCNNPVTITEYDIEKELVPGDNIIEFTPREEGNIVYTCWMGMLNGYVKVVDVINKVDLEDIKDEVGSFTPPRGAGCCGSRSHFHLRKGYQWMLKGR